MNCTGKKNMMRANRDGDGSRGMDAYADNPVDGSVSPHLPQN